MIAFGDLLPIFSDDVIVFFLFWARVGQYDFFCVAHFSILLTWRFLLFS